MPSLKERVVFQTCTVAASENIHLHTYRVTVETLAVNAGARLAACCHLLIKDILLKLKQDLDGFERLCNRNKNQIWSFGTQLHTGERADGAHYTCPATHT